MQELAGNCTTSVNGNVVVTLNCVPLVFSNIIFWALAFAGSIALLFIIFSGIKFLTSQGDPKQVEGARKTLTFAIVGLLLIFLSFAIIALIEQTTGLVPGCITRFGFTNCR